MKPKSDDLDTLLKCWSVVPVPHGRLAEPVWQRIERAQKRGWWAACASWLEGVCVRPQAVAAMMVVGLLLGLGFAEWRSRLDARRTDAEMQARYVALLAENGH